ncbi:MAG TPA: adenylate/guanylate cyclase domain-containing protein [Pseudomonadales bacterium]|nr:adenylate/guanylate cyclase domain-containing protein [Pseudomonadales bacterium]
MTASGSMATVGFFDLSPLTRSAAKDGVPLAHQVVQARLDALGEEVRAVGGRVIKQIAQELMCAFDDSRAAVDLATWMEAALDDLVGDGHSVPLRIGLHHGPVVEEHGDLFGDTVNVAARITAIALPGQILCTDEVLAHLPEEQLETARLFDHVTVKGSRKERALHRILWAPRADTLGEAAAPSSAAADESTLLLEYGGDTLRLPAGSEEIRLGRGDACELVVASEMASRFHAIIGWRRGKFVLRDQSTNGTYVGMQGSPIVVLHREELPLFGTGVISLGEAVREEHMHLIRFAFD